MQSHQLVQEDGPAKVKWLLQWDDTVLVLKDPEGQQIFELEPAKAREVIDAVDLFEERKITFNAPRGSVTFRAEGTTIQALCAFLEAGIRSEPDYRQKLKANAARIMWIGPLVFLVAACLLVLLILFAQSLPEPQQGERAGGPALFFRSVGGLLVVATLLGPLLFFHGLSQWSRIRAIEQSMKDSPPVKPT